MHLVIYYMTGLPKVYRVDHFVVAIFFVSVQIFCLATVAGVVEKERVVSSRIFHQPVHSTEYIGLRRLTHWILLVVRKDHHIFSFVAKVSVEVRGHILDVVDASSKLTALAKIVDAYEKSLPPACAVGVLESVA